ncbi:MAG: transglutaminase domain-containing protein [bacterium]|nr:transglutaminase domain-containing protein [bacterium]
MRRFLCCLLIIVNCFCLSGCSEIIDTVWGNKFIEEIEATPHLGFSNGTLFKDSEENILTLEQFGEKTIEYSSYRGSIHYDSLSAQEQIVYRALEYAMEEGYTNILVDDLIIEDGSRLPHILCALSLDSPLLEQNLRFEYGDFTSAYSVNMLNLYTRNAEFDGFYVTVNNFESSFWEKKMQALEKANEIIATLPTDINAAQKAEELFHYLADKVTYDLNRYPDNSAVYPYLYDTLIGGTSHCDGYANALSLLYNLAGINCVEKSFGSSANTETTDGPTETITDVGHTWNFVQIDNAWYNIDASEESLVPTTRSTEFHGGVLYCFDDNLQQKLPDYNEIYPPVKEGLYLKVDRHLSNVNNSDFVKQIKSAFSEHNNKWALVLVDSVNAGQLDRKIQTLANQMYLNLTYHSFSVNQNRTAIFVYNSNMNKFFK